MIVNGVDSITVSEYENELFQFEVYEKNPNNIESLELVLTRDELVELKTRIDMLLEFTK